MKRKAKITKKIVVVLITIILTNLIAFSVHALTVTRYVQEKTNWCWAASGEMVFTYISSSFSKGTFSSKQQRIVSLAGKDPTQNQTGSVVHIVTAGKEIFKSGGQFNNASYYSLTDNSFSTITSALGTKPVVISAYYEDNSKGHTMVAYAYSSSTSKIQMHDPWSGATTISVSKDQLTTSGFKSKALEDPIYGKYYILY